MQQHIHTLQDIGLSYAIPFIDLETQQKKIRPKIEHAIQRVLNHGKYVMGPEIESLEAELSSFCGVKHVITCSSGTDALRLALMAKGVGPGDAVFVPAFTFVATAEAVVSVGATPVFVDVSPDTFNMCHNSLREAIGDLPKKLKPAGIIPVDLFGQPADYDRLNVVAKKSDLWMIADAAQSFGGRLHDQPVGTLAEITCTSFFPAKPLGCYGDGGALFTNDDDLAEIIRSCRVHGQGANKYHNVRPGMTGRMDTIQAAILLEKLKIFPDELKLRAHIADLYYKRMSCTVKCPELMEGAFSSWAQYTVITPKRDRLRGHLEKHNIPTAIYYQNALSDQPAYKDCPRPRRGLPITDQLVDRVLSLPMHAYLKKPVQDIIIDSVCSCW
ncbi:MAG: DegT/DnrJ/EryC1/StrS family aminotransferase [Pseudomonadota bacterium]